MQNNQNNQNESTVDTSILDAFVIPDAVDPINPSMVDDVLAAVCDLAQAMSDNATFGMRRNQFGEAEPMETHDGHVFLSRIIWALGTQVEFHEKNLAKNAQWILQTADRAANGLEIDHERLQGLMTFREETDYKRQFWADFQDKAKGAFMTTFGRPYRDSKAKAPGAASSIALAAALREKLGVTVESKEEPPYEPENNGINAVNDTR